MSQINMTTGNITGDGQQKAVQQISCSSYLTAGIHSHLTFLSVLNSFLSIAAFFGNTLILVALHKESSLHPPSKLLLRTLATTDLCVGLISEPLTVIYWMSEMNEHWNICRFVLSAGMLTASILCSVSLLTLSAICMDRLLALLLRLQYRQVVTLKRTYVMVITIWIVSTVFTAMQYWNPLINSWYWIIVIQFCLVTSQRFSPPSVIIKIKYKAMFHNRTKQIN